MFCVVATHDLFPFPSLCNHQCLRPSGSKAGALLSLEPRR
jgi:hypothetical protein